MKLSRKVLIAMLTMLLIATSVMLCACDNTPSEYKPRKFYGTYTHFANEYYTVICGIYDEELGGRRAVIFDDIVSIDGSSYAYISKSTGEIEEKEADPLLLAKAQELINKIGTSATVKKNKIIYNDSGTVVEYDSAVYVNNPAIDFRFEDDSVGTGQYVYNADGTKEKHLYGGIKDKTVDTQGIENEVIVIKEFAE